MCWLLGDEDCLGTQYILDTWSSNGLCLIPSVVLQWCQVTLSFYLLSANTGLCGRSMLGEGGHLEGKTLVSSARSGQKLNDSASLQNLGVQRKCMAFSLCLSPSEGFQTWSPLYNYHITLGQMSYTTISRASILKVVSFVSSTTGYRIKSREM
jgi:hypothetical protein